MRTSMFVGLIVGSIIGAILVEGNGAISEMVSKGKRKVKEKINNMNMNSDML